MCSQALAPLLGRSRRDRGSGHKAKHVEAFGVPVPESVPKLLVTTVCTPSPAPFSTAPFSAAAPRGVHSTSDHLSTSNPYMEVSSSCLSWSFRWEQTPGSLHPHLSVSHMGCVFSQQSRPLLPARSSGTTSPRAALEQHPTPPPITSSSSSPAAPLSRSCFPGPAMLWLTPGLPQTTPLSCSSRDLPRPGDLTR